MTAQYAEQTSSTEHEETTQALLERQKAANRAEEDKFLQHLTGESAQAFLFNQDEQLRAVVSRNLAENYALRSQELTPDEIAQHFHESLVMVIAEARHSYDEARDAELEASRVRIQELQQEVRAATDRHSQLVYDVRVARAELNTEFMGQDDVQAIIHDKLGAIEHEHPVVASQEVEESPEAEYESAREVIRVLGSTALKLPGVAIRRAKQGLKVITGQIQKTAS